MRAARRIAVNLYQNRRFLSSYAWFPPIVLMSAVLSGCGGSMVAVHGAVAHEGKPLPGGKVIFTPVSEGQAAFGLIQEDGTFQLSTIRENDGAMAGQYRVSVLGDRPTEEGAPRMIYSGPEEFAVDVLPGQDNEVSIDIRMSDGWRVTQSD
jgi:hypothetical protein